MNAIADAPVEHEAPQEQADAPRCTPRHRTRADRDRGRRRTGDHPADDEPIRNGPATASRGRRRRCHLRGGCARPMTTNNSTATTSIRQSTTVSGDRATGIRAQSFVESSSRRACPGRTAAVAGSSAAVAHRRSPGRRRSSGRRPSCTTSTSQSIQAMASSRIGEPVTPGCHGTSLKRSSTPFFAKRQHAAPWCCAEHVHAELRRRRHRGPRVAGDLGQEPDERWIERDRGERADREPGGLVAGHAGDDRDAGGEVARAPGGSGRSRRHSQVI